MKKIIILIAIFCLFANARVLTYTKTINKVKCTIKVNPEKGRVSVGNCNILDIYFYDKYNMLVDYDGIGYESNTSYANVFLYTQMDLRDATYITVNFEEPPEPPKPPTVEELAFIRKAKKNHYHRISDGNGWECDDGYYWAEDGERCIKD